MQVGPTKDILNHEHINNFENNSLGNVNLNISNGVMPLHNTIEYQIIQFRIFCSCECWTIHVLCGLYFACACAFWYMIMQS